MVVDDDLGMRQLSSMTLRKDGFEVVEARDGREALRLLSQHQPDILLLDEMMPELNGMEVCRQIKGNPATRHIRIVFLTARFKDSDRINAFEAGADDYLTKPVTPTELRFRVRHQASDVNMWRALHVLAAAMIRLAQEPDAEQRKRILSEVENIGHQWT